MASMFLNIVDVMCGVKSVYGPRNCKRIDIVTFVGTALNNRNHLVRVHCYVLSYFISFVELPARVSLKRFRFRPRSDLYIVWKRRGSRAV